MCKVYAYLDTNTFLHWRAFHEIDWCALLSTSEVELVIPVQVMRELDRHKRSSSSRVRKRARESISRINRFCHPDCEKGEVRDGITLAVRTDAPSIDWEALGLDRNDNDDCIIAEMLSDDCGKRVVISQDEMIPRKARRHGLYYFVLPDEYKMADEPTRDDLELRDLREHKRRSEAAAPRLELQFIANGGPKDHLSVAIEKAEELDIDADTERGIADLQVQRPGPVEDQIASTHVLLGLGARSLSERIPSSEFDRYERELEEYRDSYRAHLLGVLDYRSLISRTAVIPLVLYNTGSAPAISVGIRLSFPDGFSLMSEDTFPDVPVAPNPPEKPKKPGTFSAYGLVSPPMIPPLAHLSPTADERPPSAPHCGPWIEETHSFTVTRDISHLSHNHRRELDPLYAIFDTQQEMASFHFDYWLHADNHPEPFEGMLHISIE